MLTTENSKIPVSSREEEPLVKRSIDLIFQALLPKDRLFFPLFDQACANMVETARVLEHSLKSDSVTRIQSFETINHLEKQGDEITHAIMRETGNTFIVPFDREDIHALAASIDDIADYINGSASRIHLYNVTEFTEPMRKLSEVIILQTEEIHAAIRNLKGSKNHGKMREHIVKINSLENQADDIFDNAIAALFVGEADTKRLIKAKEVLSALETATDKCEDVSHVLESILVKIS